MRRTLWQAVSANYESTAHLPVAFIQHLFTDKRMVIALRAVYEEGRSPNEGALVRELGISSTRIRQLIARSITRIRQWVKVIKTLGI